MKVLVSLMPWLFYHHGKLFVRYWVDATSSLPWRKRESSFITKNWTLMKIFSTYHVNFKTVILSYLWSCCSFWGKWKKGFKKFVWKENKYSSVLFSIKFVLFSIKFVFFCSCFWEVLLQWSFLCIHKTRETSVKASFHLLQVHF